MGFPKEVDAIKRRLSTTFGIILSLAIVVIFTLTALAQEISKITKEEVKEMFGNSDLIIIDVRLGRDWDGSVLKIKGAIKEDPRNVSSWIDKYPKDKVLVFYCA